MMIDAETMLLTILLLFVCVLTGILIGTAIVFLQGRSQKSLPEPVNYKRWYIELWDVGSGLRYAAVFDGGVTLGRGEPDQSPYGCLSVGPDMTISREQCLIYEQNGAPHLWNLSRVNPTQINGVVFNQPIEIRAGDRLKLGRHTFLLTSLARV